MFDGGYGSDDFQKKVDGGASCVVTLKNPSHPEYYFVTPLDTIFLECHHQYLALLAVGLYSGTVMVYDMPCDRVGAGRRREREQVEEIRLFSNPISSALCG